VNVETQALPAYQLLFEAYMPRMPGQACELLAAGTHVVSDLRPGPHLLPTNDAARAAFQAAGVTSMHLDPFARVPMSDPATDEEAMTERFVRALMAAQARVSAMQHVPVLAPPAPPLPPPKK